MRTEDEEAEFATEEPERSEQEPLEQEPLAPEQLCGVFRAQLIACLEEAARGRTGLFTDTVADQRAWPEAEQLRALAVALQSVLAQLRLDIAAGTAVEQFLDLCAMHGESHPGEVRLARQFLEVLHGSEERE